MSDNGTECTHPFDLRGKRVWVAGHRGMVGSALVRRLAREECETLVAGREALDLTHQAETAAWMRREQPQVVLVAAARVGGILANSRYPVDFLYDNLMIALNIMRTAHEIGVERLLWLGSSCIYPKFAAQPIAEQSLLTGPIEPTNEAYAIAKIAGLKLAEAYARQYGHAFLSAMPTNLYGPNDNFDLDNSHVIPALMRKMHEAKVTRAPTVTTWGSGTPLREFLHVDDLADALVFVVRHWHGPEHINIGSGREISIRDLAAHIANIVGFEGEILHDTSKPDGAPRKMVDTTRLAALGWRPRISLEEGLRDAYRCWMDRLEEEERGSAAPSQLTSATVGDTGVSTARSRSPGRSSARSLAAISR